MKELSSGVRDALKPQPPLSLWVSQKNTGRTPQSKNRSTTCPAQIPSMNEMKANKHMIMSMRKESGEIMPDREEILRICTDFCKSLYYQTVPTPESAIKSSPDTEKIPKFTEEEVERAIKMMKRHKAYGMDGTASDILKRRGQSVLTYLTNIFNNISKTKQIPFSWHEAKLVILFKRETQRHQEL